MRSPRARRRSSEIAACLKAPITGVSAHADLAEPAVEVAIGAPQREAFARGKARWSASRLAEPFEGLRDLSDAFLRNAGARPRVYLAALGPETSIAAGFSSCASGSKLAVSRLSRWRNCNG